MPTHKTAVNLTEETFGVVDDDGEVSWFPTKTDHEPVEYVDSDDDDRPQAGIVTVAARITREYRPGPRAGILYILPRAAAELACGFVHAVAYPDEPDGLIDGTPVYKRLVQLV